MVQRRVASFVVGQYQRSQYVSDILDEPNSPTLERRRKEAWLTNVRECITQTNALMLPSIMYVTKPERERE